MPSGDALRKYHNAQKRRYYKTIHGKAIKKFNNRRRRKRLSYINFMDNPFPPEVEVEFHHVNDMIAVPIPKQMHINARGYQHHKKCNKVILNLYGLDMHKLLRGEI